jgi:hypothetical protein
LQKSSFSPATALEKLVDGAVLMYMTNQLGTPRGRYDEHSSKSSLSCETKVYQTSRKKNQTSEGDAC